MPRPTCLALLIDEILIQAGALVNGVSILRETDVPDSFVITMSNSTTMR